MRRFQLSPCVELMEGRTLLTAGVAAIHSAAAIATTQIVFNNTATGSLSGTLGSTVNTVSLSGSASVGLMGTMSVSGTLSNSVVGTGHGSGTLVFSTSAGTITVQLTRQYPPHLSGNSLPYTFKIIGSTGGYAGYQAQGTASFTQVLAGSSISGGGPKFSLSFSTYRA